ncbi:MAG: hypothetical protein ACD_9C00139G0001, partial [uncultured bacterium]
MAKENGSIIVGVDVGSSNVRAVVAQHFRDENQLRVIGVGSSPSFGIRRGAIIDIDDVTNAINDSVQQA